MITTFEAALLEWAIPSFIKDIQILSREVSHTYSEAIIPVRMSSMMCPAP